MGKSHVLVIAMAPAVSASNANDSANRQGATPRRESSTVLRHRPTANSARGIAMRWAWRSAKRKVKKGNSVISKPGGSGGIMRVGAQKSKLETAPRKS